MSEAMIKSKSVRDLVQQDAVKNRLREIMADRAPQFAAALVQLVNGSKQLQKCEPNSVIGCALTAAALDLSIDPNLGEAYIVPYGDKAQFQLGYIGYNQLAMRSGQYKNLGWKVVHEGELVKYDELSGELEVNSDFPDAEVIGYAAKFKLLNGFERGSFWTKDRCFKHAERFSKAYRAGQNDASKRDYSVWFTDPDRACLKTVIKGLVKIWGPKSIQMQKALKVDEGAVIDSETGEVDYIDTDQSAKPSKPVFVEVTPNTPSENEGAPLKSANPEPPVAAKKETPQEPVKSENSPTINKTKMVAGLLPQFGVSEKAMLGFLLELGAIDKEVTSVLTIPDDVIEMLYDDMVNADGSVKANSKMCNKIKGAK